MTVQFIYQLNIILYIFKMNRLIHIISLLIRRIKFITHLINACLTIALRCFNSSAKLLSERTMKHTQQSAQKSINPIHARLI